MNTLIEKSSYHSSYVHYSSSFNAYYQDNALLIQFIVSAFIKTYQIFKEIQCSANQLLQPSPLFTCQSLSQTTLFLSSLSDKINELIGNSYFHQPPFLSLWTKGMLIDLKNYSEQFSINANYQNKHSINLCLAINQLWLTTLRFLELLNYLETNRQKTQEFSFFPLLQQAFQNFQNHFKRVNRSLLPLIHSYMNNENVLYFLLRNKKILVTIYGKSFAAKLSKNPAASKKLLQVLLQGYQARGYEKLLHSIDYLHPIEEAIP